MARVSGLAQVADDPVRVEVDGHAGNEECAADVDPGLREPVVVVAVGGYPEDPAALHQGVERVEYHAHEDDAEGHLRVAADEQREDERALEVVGLEEEEEREGAGLSHAVGRGPQHAHEDEDRGLHEDPSDFVGDRGAVPPVEEVAVPGLEEVKGDEDREGQEGHDGQKDVECMFHRRVSDCKTHQSYAFFPGRTSLFPSRSCPFRPRKPP